jgi:hypothetical protein
MFGYTVPSYGVMAASDVAIYRSCYCETCHRLRKDFGIVSTAAVNYDMTFIGIVLNAMSKNGIRKQNSRNGRICILGKISEENELLTKMAGYTILLTKWELEDDKNDHPSMRSNAARLALGRAIRRASHQYPEYDGFIGKGFETLRRMEDEGCTDAVLMGRTFASSLMHALKDIAGTVWNEDLEKMLVSMGTLIYVMDAVDDLNEDYMNGTYNPFLKGCKDFVNAEEYISKNLYDITETIGTLMKEMQSSYLIIRNKMNFHHGITDNIVMHGLPGSAKKVLACECIAKPGVKTTITNRILRRNE